MLEEIRNRQAVLGATIHGQKLLNKVRAINPTVFGGVNNTAKKDEKRRKGQRNAKKGGPGAYRQRVTE